MTWWTSPWVIVGVGTYGVYLLTTSLGLGWTGVGLGPRRAHRGLHSAARRVRTWMAGAGLADVSTREFAGVTGILVVVGAGIGAATFGGILPPIGVGVFAACIPAAAYRVRRTERRAAAEESWPAMIEEIRVLCGSAGRSIPQALFDVGRRTPPELRDAFTVAHREWILTTDLERSLTLLRDRLDSPTADTVAETLLVAHELGGVDLDRRLAELAEDRRHDHQARKDARARQSGVRFARRFVVIVPAGMALAGMSLGNGRSSYATASGQTIVVVALGLVAACWIWSGRMLKLPTTERVFR